MIARTFLQVLLMLGAASAASADSIGIHFVASAFSIRTDTDTNNNFSYQASRAKFDVYMPGTINDNGFVSINGPKVKIRNVGGGKNYRTKNGIGDCDGDFSNFDPVHKPSSVQLLRKVGGTAYIKVGNPISYPALFQDKAVSNSLCMQPDFSVFATNIDGSSPNGSTIKNTYSPAYDADNTVNTKSEQINNHYTFAEIPVVIDAPSGSYEYRYTHESTAGNTKIKTIWFGRITLDKTGKENPPGEDGYLLGKYTPPPVPSNQVPPDPPSGSLGGRGNTGGQIPPGEVIIWSKSVVDDVIKGALTILRGGIASSGAALSTVTPRAAVPVGTKGTMDYDEGSKAVLLQTNAAAPYSGTLNVTIHIKNVKKGKTNTVKLPVITAVQGQPTSISFSFVGKLFIALSAKGKVKLSFDNSFKPDGSKKSIKSSKK